MIIHANEVYTVNHHAQAIDVRHADCFSFETLIAGSLPGSLHAMHVARGLAENDFGLFVTVVNDEGVTRESFLMQNYMGDGRGLIVPSDDVLKSPGNFLSSELARKISVVHPEEIIQFGLGSLIKAVKRQYPKLR